MAEFKGNAYAISQVVNGLHVADIHPTKIYCNCCVENVERIEFLNASFVPERTCHIVAWYEAMSRAEIGRESVKLSCGHIVERHAKFCKECGARVVEVE